MTSTQHSIRPCLFQGSCVFWVKGCWLPGVIPGSGLCFDWQRIGFSFLGASVMPNDWIAKSCLFAQVVCVCVCVWLCVCVCVWVGGIFGKNSTCVCLCVCGGVSLERIPHGTTGSQKQRTCAYHTGTNPQRHWSSLQLPHPPSLLPHDQFIPNRFWSICVSTKLLVSWVDGEMPSWKLWGWPLSWWAYLLSS